VAVEKKEEEKEEDKHFITQDLVCQLDCREMAVIFLLMW